MVCFFGDTLWGWLPVALLQVAFGVYWARPTPHSVDSLSLPANPLSAPAHPSDGAKASPPPSIAGWLGRRPLFPKRTMPALGAGGCLGKLGVGEAKSFSQFVLSL